MIGVSFFFVFLCRVHTLYLYRYLWFLGRESFDDAAYVMTMIGAIVRIVVVVAIIGAVVIMAIFGMSLAQIIAIVQYRIRS